MGHFQNRLLWDIICLFKDEIWNMVAQNVRLEEFYLSKVLK